MICRMKMLFYTKTRFFFSTLTNESVLCFPQQTIQLGNRLPATMPSIYHSFCELSISNSRHFGLDTSIPWINCQFLFSSRQGLTEKLHLQELSKRFRFSKPRLNSSPEDDLTLKALAPSESTRPTLIPRPEVSSQYLMIPTQKYNSVVKSGVNTHWHWQYKWSVKRDLVAICIHLTN